MVGVDGALGSSTRYEVSLVYGETQVDNLQTNNRFNDRFAAALDAVVDPATGNIVCRSNLDPSAEPFNLSWNGWNAYAPRPETWAGSFTPGPDSGCVPVNILGTNAVSREAAAWIMTDSLQSSKLEQFVATAYLTGDTGNVFELPAGPIGWAAGVEYREEKSNSVPAPEDQAGLTFNNVVLPVKGRYDVSEIFGEVSVPLLEGVPFADTLTVDGAVRYSNYSTTGDATTWKTGLTWAPVYDLRLSGTVSEATRAPDIGALFDPGGADVRVHQRPLRYRQPEPGHAIPRRQLRGAADLARCGPRDLCRSELGKYLGLGRWQSRSRRRDRQVGDDAGSNTARAGRRG